MVEAKYQIDSSEHRCGGCEEDIECGQAYFSVVVFETEAQAFARRDFCVDCWGERERRPEAGSADEAGSSDEAGSADEAESPDRAETADAPSGVDAGLRFFAYWKTRRPEPNAPPPTKVRFDAEIVLDFFRHLTPPEADSSASTEPLSDAVASGAAGSDDEAEGSHNTGAAEASVGADLYPKQKRDLRFVLSLLLMRKKVLIFEGSALEEGREWLKLTDKGDPPRDFWVENPELSDDELERVRDDLGELLQMNV